MQQLVLPLEFSPALEAKDFVVSNSNKEAYLWLMRWPNWPNRSLAIYGEEGCGKTHLAKIWQSKTNAIALTGKEFDKANTEIFFENSHAFVLDDAHLIKDEEKFFHFYNHLFHSKGSFLLLSRTPPAHWNVTLPDLRSRLNATPALKIFPPDEELLFQVMQKLFSDCLLNVDEGAISFLLKHIERSFESARFWIDTLNTYALTQKRNITIPMMKEALLQHSQAERHL